MHRPPDAFLHQVVGGRWRLLEVLCATAHGAAFRAEALGDGRVARLELWDERHVEGRGELARFEREARTLSRLQHERCVSIVAFGAHEGRPFLVTDLPAGKALRDELGKADLTVPRAVSLGLQLCEGLRHLHRYGVVHRALLPENVWVAEPPAADSLKIGLPRLGPATEASDAARERLYLPPGRGRSTGRLDHRADLYAAGMLLYVMCTGREPAGDVVAATAGGTALPPPRVISPERGITEGLERVILRALAPSPEVRFGTADELMAALQSAGVGPTIPKRRPAQQPRQRTAMVAVAFATVAVVGVGAFRSSGGHGSPAPPPAQATQAPRVPAKAAIEPPPLPRVAVAPPRVEPKREITPVAPPAPVAAPIASVAAPIVPVAPTSAAPIAPTRSRTPADGERSEIWSLLDSGRLDEGAARIKRLIYKDPEAAWPRLALGVFYYRRYYRRDAVKQWQRALAQDPEIPHDPQFAAYLCFMLDDTWKAAGVTDLLNQLGAEAAPLLNRCVASAKSSRLRAEASGALDRLRSAERTSP